MKKVPFPVRHNKLFCLDKPDHRAFFYSYLDSIFYFVFINIAMLYDILHRETEYKDFSVLTWLALTCLTSFVIYQFVDRFQMTKSRKRKKSRRRKSKTERKRRPAQKSPPDLGG